MQAATLKAPGLLKEYEQRRAYDKDLREALDASVGGDDIETWFRPDPVELCEPATGCAECGGLFADGPFKGTHDTKSCPVLVSMSQSSRMHA